ncbi:MAG: hypothetical protein ITG07_02620 [Candidimonas sp.]|nr:hypothetical protein [Candidimonas sp.]
MTDNHKFHAGSEMGKQDDTSGDEKFDFELSDADLNRMSSDEDAESAMAEPEPFSALGYEAESSPEPTMTDFGGHNNDAQEVAKKSGLWKIILIGGLVGFFILALFVYFAMSILGSGSENTGPAQSRSLSANDLSLSPAPVADGGNSFPVSAVPVDVAALDAALNGPAISVPAPAVTESVVEPRANTTFDAFGDQSKNLVVTYGAESLKDEPIPANSLAVIQEQELRQVTDEERLYDSLLSSVDGMDVPPEAIKIDQSVISRTLESQRLGALESDLKAARQSIASMSGAVDSIRSQVAGFAQVIEKNSSDQAAVTASIAQLTEELKKASASQDKEIKALRDAVAKAQSRADQAAVQAGEAKKVAQTPKVERPAPVAKVVQASQRQPAPATLQPAQAAPAVAPTRVFSDAHTPPTVQATTTDSSHFSAPAQCDGNRISSVWRVKGVNNHSAYIVRSQDQEGLYLKLGLDVPGYGQVLSFDAANRAVCTTAGLIRR